MSMEETKDIDEEGGGDRDLEEISMENMGSKISIWEGLGIEISMEISMRGRGDIDGRRAVWRWWFPPEFAGGGWS